MYRTAHCGALREERVGSRVTVSGWVAHKRDMGGVIFLDLRDCKGTLQAVCNRNALTEAEFGAAENVRLESVLMLSGVIRIRDEETYNPRLETGTIELAADSLRVLSEAEPLPFSLEDGKVREDLRMEYRFLDIRRPAMQESLRFRHRVVKTARAYLDADGFVDVETPILTKSTPEGARDYLVPSRVHPGTFYALPQSPQLFKQLLMVGGLDRYYQVARCFRDEDLRADRQPEFTQLDMELSFADQEEILQHLERLFKHIMREIKGIDIAEPFPRMTWTEAMDHYGSDKPDLRFGMPIVDVTDIAEKSSFSVFRSVAQRKGFVRALNVKGGGLRFSKTDIEGLTGRALSYGAKGMAWILLREDGSVNSILPKYFPEDVWNALIRRVEGGPGDFILFSADTLSTVRKTLGGLRLELGDLLGLRDKNEYKFLIVTDFPEFEYSEEENRWMAMHHPFTMPYEEDLPYLFSDPGRVRAQAYDVVLNGIELGSGSIRIHDSAVQAAMFKALGFSDEEAERRFGFFLRAFRYGTPPHGGFAFGLDRLVMLLLGAESLRDITAFPKTKDARCLLTNAPDVVDEAQLKELHIHAGDAPREAAQAKKAAGDAFDIRRVAQLASLSIEPEKLPGLEKELSAIIRFAGQLEEADTAGVPPMEHVAKLVNVFREDEAKPAEPGPLLENAPSLHGEYIRVPAAIE